MDLAGGLLSGLRTVPQRTWMCPWRKPGFFGMTVNRFQHGCRGFPASRSAVPMVVLCIFRNPIVPKITCPQRISCLGRLTLQRSAQVLEENPKQSTWTLQTTQFGREWTLSWVAQNLTPIPNQKIHWHSVPGTNSSGIEVNNRGSIRFYRTGPTSCNITLTISYEVPQVLAPFANALQPIVESILGPDMERFAKHAVAVSPSNAREPQE